MTGGGSSSVDQISLAPHQKPMQEVSNSHTVDGVADVLVLGNRL